MELPDTWAEVGEEEQDDSSQDKSKADPAGLAAVLPSRPEAARTPAGDAGAPQATRWARMAEDGR
eukprot:CAMPEP_0195089244 /NCGR_PEP_ID=MMETSP0448-20130528/28583_1 /TAXON_ID=66468 /ORGANISM="Heterocapsa triquestra, Strain CCMP 448" /LENGTH=64 /DNA_ID=CAMNT_0040122961 /DNA_START=10 /DNA_END=202 /DNA_ORIENTATION=-